METGGGKWIQHWIYSYLLHSTWNQHVGMKCPSYAWVMYIYILFLLHAFETMMHRHPITLQDSSCRFWANAQEKKFLSKAQSDGYKGTRSPNCCSSTRPDARNHFVHAKCTTAYWQVDSTSMIFRVLPKSFAVKEERKESGIGSRHVGSRALKKSKCMVGWEDPEASKNDTSLVFRQLQTCFCSLSSEKRKGSINKAFFFPFMMYTHCTCRQRKRDVSITLRRKTALRHTVTTRTTYSKRMTNPGTCPVMWNVRTAAHGSLRGGSKMREKYNLFTCILYVRRVNAAWPCNIKRWNGMTSCMQQERKHLEWLKQLVQMVCVFFRTEFFFADQTWCRHSCINCGNVKEVVPGSVHACVCDDLVHSRNAAQYEDRLSGWQMTNLVLAVFNSSTVNGHVLGTIAIQNE